MPLEDPAHTLAPILTRLGEEARRFLGGLDTRPVRAADPAAAARAFGGALPSDGVGAPAALDELIAGAAPALVASGGPRFFHLVVGGSTDAALGADWLATLWDQIAASSLTSPLAVRLEEVAVAWLREAFELPAGAGVLTTGGHGANLIGLLAARQWWGERHGRDVSEEGLSGLPRMPVLSSGLLHASAVKALAQLGLGRRAAQRFAADPTGRADLAALEAALVALDGAPAVIVANAGDVNTGAFDPLDAMADLAERYGAWLHVDGAFGLFARVSPRTAALARGAERAQSIASDCHKWLNVPYDCGVAFVQDKRLLVRANKLVADYLPREGSDAGPGTAHGAVLSNIALESSRRARGLAVWATLRASGRAGLRALVEGSLDRAQELAALIDAAPDLERLAPVPLNIVCFRAHPVGARKRDLDALNERLARAVLEDGRVFLGSTRYAGRVALRAAFVNHRTRPEDVQLAGQVLAGLLAQAAFTDPIH
ncbi:MAG: pyridoxal-dependent decarboxylase [Planctomycetota bacterium]